MDNGVLVQFKDLGLVSSLFFAAVGSALGTGIAGLSAIGAWKKAFMQNKAAPMILVAFVGAPLSQTIYGMILMGKITAAAAAGQYFWSMGILGGLGIGGSAYFQGKTAAAACDALGETGKGFTNYLFVLGIIETVALFVMVFLMGQIDKLMVVAKTAAGA